MKLDTSASAHFQKSLRFAKRFVVHRVSSTFLFSSSSSSFRLVHFLFLCHSLYLLSCFSLFIFIFTFHLLEILILYLCEYYFASDRFKNLASENFHVFDEIVYSAQFHRKRMRKKRVYTILCRTKLIHVMMYNNNTNNTKQNVEKSCCYDIMIIIICLSDSVFNANLKCCCGKVANFTLVTT